MGLADLENLIGYRFRSPELLERALTHSSWANENKPAVNAVTRRRDDNETLEFLGDSVLGLVIAEKLLEAHPGLGEGSLTVMKHRLVSASTLASVAKRLRVGDFVRVSRGLEIGGGRDKTALLADTLEALIGAVFLDGGYQEASHMVARSFSEELSVVTPQASVDFKSLLQERLQARKLETPRYTLIEESGPPHDRMFRVEAAWAGGRAEGTGRSIKLAEMDAASKVLESMADD